MQRRETHPHRPRARRDAHRPGFRPRHLPDLPGCVQVPHRARKEPGRARVDSKGHGIDDGQTLAGREPKPPVRRPCRERLAREQRVRIPCQTAIGVQQPRLHAALPALDHRKEVRDRHSHQPPLAGQPQAPMAVVMDDGHRLHQRAHRRSEVHDDAIGAEQCQARVRQTNPQPHVHGGRKACQVGQRASRCVLQLLELAVLPPKQAPGIRHPNPPGPRLPRHQPHPPQLVLFPCPGLMAQQLPLPSHPQLPVHVLEHGTHRRRNLLATMDQPRLAPLHAVHRKPHPKPRDPHAVRSVHKDGFHLPQPWNRHPLKTQRLTPPFITAKQTAAEGSHPKAPGRLGRHRPDVLMSKAALHAHHLDRLAAPPGQTLGRRPQPDVPLVVPGAKGRRRKNLAPGSTHLHDTPDGRQRRRRFRGHPPVIQPVPSRANPQVALKVLVQLPERLHVHVQPDPPDHALRTHLQQLSLPHQPQPPVPRQPRPKTLRRPQRSP